MNDKGSECILINTVENWVSEEETFLIPTEVETMQIYYKSQVWAVLVLVNWSPAKYY